MPVEVYFKDPDVAARTVDAGLDDEFTTPWEPGLRDGRTSARFASSTMIRPGTCSHVRRSGIENGIVISRRTEKTILDGQQKNLYQYHQLSVWAIVQNTLDFFESSFALGRRISWAFEGNRLIIVPHARYGENASTIGRASRCSCIGSTMNGKGKVFTCLSSDIVNHEFGHALLEGCVPRAMSRWNRRPRPSMSSWAI